jgi:hypothetical protein
MFLLCIIVINVGGINASFMMPRSAANALKPSCMCSIVVTVLPFAYQADSFVVCNIIIGQTLKYQQYGTHAKL